MSNTPCLTTPTPRQSGESSWLLSQAPSPAPRRSEPTWEELLGRR